MNTADILSRLREILPGIDGTGTGDQIERLIRDIETPDHHPLHHYPETLLGFASLVGEEPGKTYRMELHQIDGALYCATAKDGSPFGHPEQPAAMPRDAFSKWSQSGFTIIRLPR